MSDWVTLKHEHGGTTSVPDREDVVAAHEARGWVRVDDDELAEQAAAPFVPASTDAPDGAEWVDLVHPDLPTGTNRVPNNAAAIAGALEAGWTYPKPPADAVEDELRELHPRGGRPTKAEREAAEQRAAAAAAATDDPPEVPSGDQTAGDGKNEE
jgi:hypothetical protein